MVVRNSLTMGRRVGEDRVTPYSRPPADDGADQMLVRTVQCVKGQVEIELACDPVFDYGRTSAKWTLLEGNNRVADAVAGNQKLRLQGSIPLGIEGDSVRGRPQLGARRGCLCSLSWADGLAAPGDEHDDANARMAATTRFWRTWLGHARIPDHRWRFLIMRSALVIKGLSYLPTGATVTTLTTSLPETPGGERNWDYRYCWMRK